MRCIISDAHEVVQATETGLGNPESEHSKEWPSTKASHGKYVCVACGKRGALNDMFSGGCKLTIYGEHSGWKPMAGTSVFNIPPENEDDEKHVAMWRRQYEQA